MGDHDWFWRVNLSMVGVSVIDSYNVATKYLSYEDTSNALLCDLNGDIIGNDMDSSPTRPPSCRTGRSA